MRTIVIMGAASRDFNVVFRDDPDIRGAAFSAASASTPLPAGCFSSVSDSVD
jgi:hypothetical protein